MEEDDFYLKWEKHHNAFVSVFDSLYKHNILVDCTLAAEEKFIKAHRIVLMACSPYLEELLSHHCDNYPIVFLDIKFSVLQAIVDFCYRGEVKLPHNELSGFIKAANTLRIKGLCNKELNGNSNGKKRRESRNNNESPLMKRQKNSSNQCSVKMENQSEVFESANVPDVTLIECGVTSNNSGQSDSAEGKTTEEQEATCEQLMDGTLHDNQTGENHWERYDTADQGSDNSDVDSDDSDSSEDGETDVTQMLRQDGRSSYIFPWSCNRCGEAFSSRSLFAEHRKHCFDLVNHPWACHKCPSTYKNKKDLVRHLIYCGNEVARLVCNRCGNTYKYERGLKRHQKYCGTGTKPLKCAHCKKTYKYKRGLRRHQSNCVGIFGDLIAQLPIIVKTETIKEPDLNSIGNISGSFSERWTCSCGKEYKYKKSYVKHIELCTGESSQNRGDEIIIDEPDETNLKNITI